MKILNVEASNFGSYKHITFDFDSKGLCLIQGPTGSGKSTVLDLITWCLYGVTAKGGNADDVKTWNGGDCSGSIRVSDAKGSEILIVRTRSQRGKNDLYWTESGGEVRRGKDLVDTQKLISECIGLSEEVFLQSVYFHEFSTTGTFFYTNAKGRRELLEKIADLSFPKAITEKASLAVKKSKSELALSSGEYNACSRGLSSLQSELATLESKLHSWSDGMQLRIESAKTSSREYVSRGQDKIKEIQAKEEAWEKKKYTQVEDYLAKIEKLQSSILPQKHFDVKEAEIRDSLRCDKCGSLPQNINDALTENRVAAANNKTNTLQLKATKVLLDSTTREVNPYTSQLEDLLSQEVNPYVKILLSLEAETNPYNTQYDDKYAQLRYQEQACYELEATVKALQTTISDLDRLQDLSLVMRAYILTMSVMELQDKTNEYLNSYFEGELSVKFELKDYDNIEVSIFKSGNLCNFKQLSRGQRGMLKLCFGVAVMKASANQAGQYMNVLAFDEVLDGFSDDLKCRSYDLFLRLSQEHDTVLVIDHSEEFKGLFANQYKVSLSGDSSEIQQV